MVKTVAEEIRKYIDPNEPRELRLTAAKGLIPLGPKELTQILSLLAGDEDSEVSSEARKSLNEVPAEVISTVLSDTGTSDTVLDYFGRNSEDDSTIERVIVNSSTTDSTISYLAEITTSQNILELISNNHERIVRSSEIVEALSKNPAVSRSTLDNVLDYLSLYLGEDKKVNISVGESNPETEQNDSIEIEPGSSFLDSAEVSSELIDESGEEAQSEDPDDEAGSENIQTEISMMTIGEKIKTAIKGNRESRTVLIRDPNRIVSRAVLKNPRLTDTEIVIIAQSKIVSDDVLREISDTRRWIKMYPVKHALVTNPKTPPHISVNLVRHLRDFDLRAIMWSKNLPGVITTTARNIVRSKRDGK